MTIRIGDTGDREVLLNGQDIYDRNAGVLELRSAWDGLSRLIPFPHSIFSNVAFAASTGKWGRNELAHIVEESLRGAVLWMK